MKITLDLPDNTASCAILYITKVPSDRYIKIEEHKVSINPVIDGETYKIQNDEVWVRYD